MIDIKVVNYYISKKFYTFPVNKDKTPMTPHGYKDSSVDAKVWAEWINKLKPEAIGLDCGKSGIVAVDIDVKNGNNGYEEFSRLGIDYSGAYCSKTPSGGMHIMFTNNTGKEIKSSSGKIGKGIDIKAAGGYVILPPSNVLSGSYARYGDWKDRPAPVPKKLLDLIASNESNNIEIADNEEVFLEGTRNTNLFKLGAKLWSTGITHDALINALNIENKKRCVPPLGIEEIESIYESITKFKQNSPYMRMKTNDYKSKVELYWQFATSVYANPEAAVASCSWLRPNCILIMPIKRFWEIILNGGSHIEAADRAGIVHELTSRMATFNEDTPVEIYAERIAEEYYFYRANSILAKASNAIYNRDKNLLISAIDELRNESGVDNKQFDLGISDSIGEFKETINNLQNRIIKSGIEKFDDVTVLGGFERQTLSIIAARPSMGKTALVLQIAFNASMRGYKVLFYSLEMSKVSLIARKACGKIGISWTAIKSGNISKENIEKLSEAADEIEKYHSSLIIIDKTVNTMNIEKDVKAYKPDLVVIDHIRLLTDEGDNENLRLGYISAKLKEIAKENNCHVMVAAQLNRMVETRADKLPQLSDLRESGQIEENADVVLMLHRRDYYELVSNNDSTTQLDVLVRKNRDGIAGGAIKLQFDMNRQYIC